MRSFKLKLISELAKLLYNDLKIKHRGVIIQELGDYTLKYTFKPSIITKYVSIDAFKIMLSKMKLYEDDYLLEELI